MSQDYTKSSFKKLLEKLQEESWQLELIISGFAIFGLFTAYPEIKLIAKEVRNEDNIFGTLTLMVVSISCLILIFNLLLHVILRGLWIGAIGLRYVSGDIDYDALKYSDKFTNHLKKRVGSFDKYIGTLETYCSVIFAISFLLIFYIISFALIMFAITMVSIYMIGEDGYGGVLQFVGILIVSFLSFGMFFVFLDFITQGWLKKKQWTSMIYFPFYWVFSFVTLSFLYRPLVYNFLDNKFGRRMSFLLVPIYLGILVLSSLHYVNSNYLDKTDASNSFYANNRNYESLIEDKEDVFINRVAIPSKVITDPFLRIFVVYEDNVEDAIFNFEESLKPEDDKRGLRFNIQFNNDGFTVKEIDSIKAIYLKTFDAIHTIKIDSLVYKASFIISQSKKAELGFETYLDIDSLSEGKHLLEVDRMRIRRKDTTTRTIRKIPFWYFKD